MNKKRLILTAVLVIAMVFSTTCFSLAANPVTVDVNGNDVAFDQAPIIENGRTLVPLRAIFEALGYEVEWDARTKTVICDWGYDSLSLRIGENVINMGDGRAIKIDVPAKILNGRTLVPLRAISESLGADVAWNAKTRHISVIKTWNTWYAENEEEFLAGIMDDSKIVLAPGTYNLTKYLDDYYFGETGYDLDDNAYLSVEDVFDGFEIHINNVKNLHIEAADPDLSTEIVVEPRYATVLNFIGCRDISLKNLTLGHTIEKGSCQGDVVHFDKCRGITMDDVDMYGCGAYALDIRDTIALNADNCVVRDCSYGMMEVFGSTGIQFKKSTFRNNSEFTMIELGSKSQVRFDNCRFFENSGNFIYTSDSKAVFDGCYFDDNDYMSLYNNEAVNTLITITNTIYD